MGLAAGLGVGAAFESEFGTDPRSAAVPLRCAALEVGEYVFCLNAWRRLATVRAFLNVAAAMATAG